MGGYGSGRHGARAVVEEGLKLDLRRLRQQGLFKVDGLVCFTTLSWTQSYSGETVATAKISYSTREGRGWFQVQYRFEVYNGEVQEVDEQIQLTSIPQPFGGRRWYFICPKSGRRCQCLYKPCGYPYFRSRQVFHRRLQYMSQKHNWRSRLFETSRRTAKRILRAGPREWRERYADWDFPPKPPRMRWKTYEREFAKWEKSEKLSDALLVQCVSKLGKI